MTPFIGTIALAATAAFALAELPKEPLLRFAALKQAPADPSAAHGGALSGELVDDKQAVIGVAATQIDDALASHLGLAKGQGVVLVSVPEDRPAAKAGVKQFDVLLSVDGSPVASQDDVRKLLSAKQPGEAVTLSIRRGADRLELAVVTEASSDLGSTPLRLQQLAELAYLQGAKGLDPKVLKELAVQEHGASGSLTKALAARSQLNHADADQQALSALMAEQEKKLDRLHGNAADEQRRMIETLRKLEVDHGARAAELDAERDHLAALQEALASNVDRLEVAKRHLVDQADDLKLKIEAEAKARFDGLKGKLGEADAEKLAQESQQIAENVHRSLLEARDQLQALGGHAGELELARRAALEQNLHHELLARENAIRAAAERADVERAATTASRDGVDMRLGAIEERLARIEEMLSKLVKRGSEN